MNITIDIKAPELATAIQALAEALTGKGAMVPTAAPTKKEEKTENVKKPDPAPEEDPKTEEEQPKVTLEVVRAKLSDISQSGKQEEVKALLTSYGVKKLTQLPKEKYAELLQKAEEIK
ncbi:hypothetical protein V1503_24805 [Bacillus sp. SCS-151]|uniref:hypothetical protein n=1 Tax=Nanhaiella sioensis TaxID=3115293 RepID=UPI00397E8345